MRVIGNASVAAAAQLQATRERRTTRPGAAYVAPRPGGDAGPAAARPVTGRPSPATGDRRDPGDHATGGHRGHRGRRSRAEPAGTRQPVEELLAELDALIGLRTVKREVHRQVALLRVEKLRAEAGLRSPTLTRHLVFTGNPGTGKTTVARLVAGIYHALGLLTKGQLVEVDRSELVAGYLGQTAIKTAEVVASAAGGVLFIDEAYSPGRRPVRHRRRSTRWSRRWRTAATTSWSSWPATRRRWRRSSPPNPGLASRFRTTIEFEDYTDDELVADPACTSRRGADYELVPEARGAVPRAAGRDPARAARSATAGSPATCSRPRSAATPGGCATSRHPPPTQLRQLAGPRTSTRTPTTSRRFPPPDLGRATAPGRHAREPRARVVAAAPRRRRTAAPRTAAGRHPAPQRPHADRSPRPSAPGRHRRRGRGLGALTALAGTPGRMRVVAALGRRGRRCCFGLGAGQAFRSADGALERARRQRRTSSCGCRTIQTNLVQADADATNAFLVGGLEPAAQRADYDRRRPSASQLIAEAAQTQPADGAALGARQRRRWSPTPSAVEQARANNRQALPVGRAVPQRRQRRPARAEARCRRSSHLVDANDARATQEFDDGRRAALWLVLARRCSPSSCSAWRHGLAGRGAPTATSTCPLAGATVAVLVALVAGWVGLAGVASRVDEVRDGPYAATLATAQARDRRRSTPRRTEPRR